MKALAKVTNLPVDTGVSGWDAILSEHAPAITLEENQICDFLIIGAGFAGLSAARRLAQLKPDARIIILDAKCVAEGPAGRNSGFMIDLPHDLSSSDYATTHENDLKQIRLNRSAIAFAQSAAEEYGLAKEAFTISGKVNGAVGEKAVSHNHTYARHLDELNEPYKMLDADAMKVLTGSGFYKSGIYTPGTAMLQPALYVKGLAQGLGNRASIFENSPVISLEKENQKWVAKTPKGSVSAKKVILATNGHIESFGHFKRKLLHVILYASMTRKLTIEEAHLTGEKTWGITPSDPAATTMRKISGTGGTRIITRNRMSYAPDMKITNVRLAQMGKTHITSFAKRYPELSHVEQEYLWSGRLCLSRNGASAFGELEEGLYSACCQNGLGAARGTLSGMAIAELASEGETELAREILLEENPQKLPIAPLDAIGVRAFMKWSEHKARHEL
jgi:glycine/D-amino acid oxidase-like deaminating enzyme